VVDWPSLCHLQKTSLSVEESLPRPPTGDQSTVSHDPKDFISGDGTSDCCDAPVLSGGMCSFCREHCETVSEEEDDVQIPPHEFTGQKLDVKAP